MAKTVVCPFCGSEMESKLFTSDAYPLCMGDISVPCCQKCSEMLDGALTNEDKKRLGVKLGNKYYSTRAKKNNREIALDVVRYIDEMQALEAERLGDSYIDSFNVFYGYTDDRFWAEEFKLGFVNGSISLKDMVKARKTAEKNLGSTAYFTKDDITKLEFRIQHIDPGLFTSCVSFDVRLNDEKVITYRPAILRGAFSYHHFLFRRRKARKQIRSLLEQFKEQIGSSLPVAEIKKFR